MAEPYNPYQGQTLSPYEPTLRDRIAAMLLGSNPSFDKRRSIEGLIGSSGLGTTGFSLADITGVGGLLDAQQEAASGNYRNAAMAIMPGAGPLKKATTKGAKEASKAVENAQRDVNILFVNDLTLIFDGMGIVTNVVLDAAGTK